MEPRNAVLVRKSVFSLPWCRNPLLLLFTLLVLSASYCNGAYHSHDITSDSVCNQYRKRELDVYMTKPVILESRPETIGKLPSGSPLSCNYEVEAKGGMRLGVVSVVQKMSFRSQGDYCLDYMQTIYRERKGIKLKHHKKKDRTKKILKHVAKKIAHGDRFKRDADERGPRVCGDVLFGLHVDKNETMPPPFAAPLPPTVPTQDSLLLSIVAEVQNFNPYQTLVSEASDVDPKGELKTHLYVSNRMLRVDEAIKMKVVYSAYQACNGLSVPDSLFHCGYGLCISRSLVNDGLVNCPFGDCIDETNCTNAKSATVTAQIIRHEPVAASSSSGTWTGIIVLVVIGALVCGCVVCFFIAKRRKRSKAQETEDDEEYDEDKGEEMVTQSPQQQLNAPATYYPTQPVPGGSVPGYAPPPGGQPGYYPLVPQQPPQGYAPSPWQQPAMGQQPPPGYPGPPPEGYLPPQGPAPGTYPQYPPAPGYPPPPAGAPLQQSSAPVVEGAPPGGAVGFSYPPPGSGYPPAGSGYPPAGSGYPPYNVGTGGATAPPGNT